MQPIRFRENLKKLMQEKQISINSLARAVKLTPPGLSKILSGKTADPGMSVVDSIAQYLGVKVQDLIYGEGADENIDRTYLPPNARRVPMLNWVQAGDFTHIDPHEVEEWVLCPDSIGPQGFCLTVRGESMEPEFYAGDVVFVDPEREWHSGSVVIVRDDAHGESAATMKKFVEDETGKCYLRPANPAWPQQFINVTETMRIVGVVIGKYSSVKT